MSNAALEGVRGRTHVGAALHFGLDEPQEVLLVHAARMVHVRVDFPRVVKVAKGSMCSEHTNRTRGITNRCGTLYRLASEHE